MVEVVRQSGHNGRSFIAFIGFELGNMATRLFLLLLNQPLCVYPFTYNIFLLVSASDYVTRLMASSRFM